MRGVLKYAGRGLSVEANAVRAVQCQQSDWIATDWHLWSEMGSTAQSKELTLAQILSDLGTLKACPASLRAGVLSERGTGLSTLPIESMNDEDESEDIKEAGGHGTEETGGQGTGREETLRQVEELLRMKKAVETWVKREGEGDKRLGEVREVEEKVRDVLVQMSRYMDV